MKNKHTKKIRGAGDAPNVQWLKVDNAGKIYPAARRSNWTALFRVSATLTEDIDPVVLDEAQRNTLKRFPNFCVRLRSGLFWYYLEKKNSFPELQRDVANPCVHMDWRKNDGFMLRVRYYNKTIALEVFHVLSDGTGGQSFLLTLVAEYLRLKHGAKIAYNDTILDCSQTPQKNEIEDAFIKYARAATQTRAEANAYHFDGTDERPDRIHVTTGIIPVNALLTLSREKKVSLTEYLASVMIMAIDKVQLTGLTDNGRLTYDKIRRKLRPVKVGIPVNLRKFYPTNTKRNFASYINVGIDPRLGRYEFDEVLEIVHHQMGLEFTEKNLNAKFSTNVISERNIVLSLTPLFLKNFAMKAVFMRVGDNKTTTTLSNLGNITLPDGMKEYVSRLDFLVGPLSINRVVVGMVSYNGNLVINFVRTMMENDFEREFFRYLVKLGIHVTVSSNNLANFGR